MRTVNMAKSLMKFGEHPDMSERRVRISAKAQRKPEVASASGLLVIMLADEEKMLSGGPVARTNVIPSRNRKRSFEIRETMGLCWCLFLVLHAAVSSKRSGTRR